MASVLAWVTDVVLNLVAVVTPPRVHFGYVCVVVSATCAILYFGLTFNIFPDPPGSVIPAEELEPDEALLGVGMLAAGLVGLIVISAAKNQKRSDAKDEE